MTLDFIMLRLGKVSVQSLQHWCSLDVVLQIIKSLIKLIVLIAVDYILLTSNVGVVVAVDTLAEPVNLPTAKALQNDGDQPAQVKITDDVRPQLA